jgi:protein-tyrosine phosphatase
VLIESLKSAARGARHLPDRLLHPWRRRSALHRLGRAPLPRTALFVCHGNICRSPYAAAVARRLLPAGVAVESAGFIGPDRPSPPEAIAVAGERGLDLTPHRSQVIEMEHVREVDLVVVMDSEQRHRLVSSRPELGSRVVLLGDLDPEPITRRTVLDPVEQPAEVFRTCYDRIDRCVGALATLWRTPGADDAQGQGGKLEQRRRSKTDQRRHRNCTREHHD